MKTKQEEVRDETRSEWNSGQSYIEGAIVSPSYALCHAFLPSFVHSTSVCWLRIMGRAWSRHMGHGLVLLGFILVHRINKLVSAWIKIPQSGEGYAEN